ncbi:MAG: FtsK/SpoIIIE domain-containing protein [Bifidobacterium sp.]|uniref:FtsK/SpoIIIE domain-containing protein n=1 Tax=Bifidobacterium sp. TaxID=41200 RepID=UPI003F0C86DF
MAIIMGLEGRWMFIPMAIPGLIGCLASAILAIGGSDADLRSDTGTPTQVSDDACAALGTSPESPTGNDAPPPSELDTPEPLETLLGLDRDPMLWRAVVRTWAQGLDSSSPGSRAREPHGPAAQNPARHRRDSPHLDVPIGTCGTGVFTLDIARQGPHALVAGTTGSGKSVALLVWCLALAARNPPSRVNFVFMDFKGGATFQGLADLPHCVGNVCDLDLAHAARALLALERELRRREQLVASQGCSSLAELDNPPPALVIVVDEFHAIRSLLPDYLERLTRVTSLGRSLGMHLIACTQNPLGQVSAEMKANMRLHLCLRVNDAMQSRELLDSPVAQAISPSCPGGAYLYDGEALQSLRCTTPVNSRRLIRHIAAAGLFLSPTPATMLFTPPLPEHLDRMPANLSITDHDSGSMRPEHPNRVVIGIKDDGVVWHPASIDVSLGNIAIIGRPRSGKSNLLDVLCEQSRIIGTHVTRWTVGTDGARCEQRFAAQESPRRPARELIVVDDADELADPLSTDPYADQFRRALQSPDVTVAFAAGSLRHIRVPQDAPTRVVFPTGDRVHDLGLGIPAAVLASMPQRDFTTAGRAVVLDGPSARPVQCLRFQVECLRYQSPHDDDISLGQTS